MKTIVIAALLALSFTTGFTCSKNAPEQAAQPAAQEQMAAPAEGQPAAEGQAAPAAEAQPAAAAPAGEQK